MYFTGDWHLDNTLSNRIPNSDELQKKLLKKYIKKIKGDLFILGDLFHTHNPTINSLQFIVNLITENKNVNFHILMGNHDWKNKTVFSLSFLKVLEEIMPNLKVYVEPTYYKNYLILPYPFNLEEYLLKDKVKYILAHIETYGAKRDNSTIVRYLSGYSLGKDWVNELKERRVKVITGHYHSYQKISDTVFYSGSPYQLSFGEDDKKYILKLKSNKVKPIKLKPPYSLQNIQIRDKKDLKAFRKILSYENPNLYIKVKADRKFMDEVLSLSSNFDNIFVEMDVSRNLNIEKEIKNDNSPTTVIDYTYGLKEFLESYGLEKKYIKKALKLVEEALSQL